MGNGCLHGLGSFSRGKKFDSYDFICKYVKRLICLSSNIARKRYHEIKSFVNYGPLWKHLLNYYFFLTIPSFIVSSEITEQVS